MDVRLDGSVAVVKLEGGKANAIDARFLEVFGELLDECRGARALVLTGYDAYFSAGLDLRALAAYDRPAMRRLTAAFHDAVLRLFTLEVPVVAALNGHCVAGGCILAMQADVRLVADVACKVGFSETALGIGLPIVAIETLRAQLPPPTLHHVLLSGRAVGPAEALALGLVHRVVPPAALLDEAVRTAAELAAGPGGGYALIKRFLRRPVLEALARHGDEDQEAWLDTWFSAEGTAARERVVAKLGKKS